MIECERIISEGIVESDFLKEETKDDYTISGKMKKVWAIELDLLKRFDQICEKHHLRYWAGFGTLLGAVRHHGFIPWDDDMDLWMPRDDYDKLLSLDLDLEKPYFLQTTLNDNDYYNSFARIRNSRTTGIKVSKNNKCNNGIYIDIYPLDGIGKSPRIHLLKCKYIRINNVLAHAYVFNINPKKIMRLANVVLHLPFVPYSYKSTYKRINRIARKVRWDETDKVGFVVFDPYHEHKKNIFDKKDFDVTVKIPFENLLVPVPAGYDNILKIIYGDYMAFPPVEERGKKHTFVFEPDIPYKEFDLANTNVE